MCWLMTATQIIYQDAMLNKEFSRISLLKSAQGTFFILGLKCHMFYFPLVYLLTLEEKCRIAMHLEAMEFDVSLVATEWFLCLFSKSLPSEVKAILCLSKIETCWNQLRLFLWLTLSWGSPFFSLPVFFPWKTTLRVWDILFYEGAKVILHVALAIFKVQL